MIRTLEELSANAWPALQTLLYDGWILRFANGYTRRANSILPLYPSQQAPLEKLVYCQNLYRQRGLPTIFKLAGRAESHDLNTFLLGQGYRAEADTSVQTIDLLSRKDEVSSEIRFSLGLTPEWQTAFQEMNGLSQERQGYHTQILRSILPQTCYASVSVDGQVAGCALGVLENGTFGIFDVVIHPDYRKQGHGERLMRALLAWAQQQGGHTAYLQVMLNNAPAQRLYARLGFKEQYQYWYCVK
jgi:ribosomal protein S18 acetylase RimI-like enzyme